MRLRTSLVGALLSALAAVAVLALVRARGLVALSTTGPWLTVGSLLVGLLTATTGGGGLVLAPLMLAAGLRGATFIATGAVVATTMHRDVR